MPSPSLPVFFGARLAPGLARHGLGAAMSAQAELLGPLLSLLLRLPVGLLALWALSPEAFVLPPVLWAGHSSGRCWLRFFGPLER